MVIIKKIFVILALSIIPQYAYATTYYIDSELGNDSWSGKLAVKAGGTSIDGPWQSLNRLANATLSPGDVIELQCGRKWMQTLRLKNSGTSGQPIIIRPASSTCEVPPRIDGSHSVSARNWTGHDNAIYKVSWPVQQLQNGSLATGVGDWTSWSASADQKIIHESNCPDSLSNCAAFTSSLGPSGSIAISNNFLVEGGVAYNGDLSLRIPTGVKVKVLVRRGSPPYEPISAMQWLTGTNAWQKINFVFVSPYTVSNARLDIEVPPAGVKLHFKDASLKPLLASPIGAWIGDLPLLPAYHPNRGHDATRPTSVYATAVVADADAIPSHNGRTGSTYLDIDSSLKLPQGVTPKAGNRLRIRSAPWRIDEVTITSVVGNRLNFAPATSYPIRAGQGYLLLDALGTLDSPGEWLYDASTNSAFIWTPDGSTPAEQTRLSVLEKGIDLSNRSNVTIEGINIQHTGLGIDLTNAQNITIDSISIVNTVRQGILATNAKQINITSSRFWRTGGDAIASLTSSFLRVTKNDISESAVTVDADRVWSLPTPTNATIQAGASASIVDNRISHSGGIGIWARENSNVEKNAVADSCLLINDCAGIYVNYASPNTRIASNLIERVSGNTDGVIDTRTHAVGIYLDDLSTNMKVEDNSVAWADFGIQVHNAFNNQVSGNILFGNRQFQILMQEQTNRLRAEGDIYINKIEGNTLIPTKPAIALMMQSSISLTSDFGTFERNHYSALLSSRVVGKRPSKGLYAELRFEEWQATSANVNNGRDGSGRVTNPIGYAASRIVGGSIVPNGKLTSQSTGWSTWNQSPPSGQLNLENCTLVGPCLHRSAGGSDGLISSPNFSIQADVWYRVSFDVKTAEAGQPFEVIVRRDGWGTNVGYESLMGKSEAFAGGSEWKRYSFSFKATKSISAGDPATGERGARVDFEKIPAGKTLYIANLEIVPTTALETGLNLRKLTNTDRDAVDIPCPDEDSAPETCANYVRFSNQEPVSWPVNLLALGTEIVFTRDPSLVDGDADGIADIQDHCPRTPANEATDAGGCGLSQTPE
ncbi:MAG: right-handed parallel beta-helix repeat-containing protein [Nitrosospira sp.]|nr:right-handed parallel beta-helix repeat-containing protein [Nitrosospira sp.]